MQLRVFLAGRVAIECDGVVIDDGRFPGRQGRLLFAYLVAEQNRPVRRDELAEALWGDAAPATWEKALSVLVSKIRALLGDCGIDGSRSLTSAFGCYKVTLPADSWIDVVAADDAAAAAACALADGKLGEALANASAAAAIARGTFVPGEEGPWVAERRAELQAVLARALVCLAQTQRRAGDAASAVRAAEELVLLEPFRDSGYRLLMEAQAAAGNDAEALRTYERCRTLLAEELGAFPSAETEAVYLELLRGSVRSSTPAVAETETADAPPGSPPPPASREPAGRRRRKLAILAAAAVLIAGLAATGLVLARSDAAHVAVLPNSVVRIDPSTLEPTQVVRVGREPDLIVVAGGFVWVTHRGRRYTGPDSLRTRVTGGSRVSTRRRVRPRSSGEASHRVGSHPIRPVTSGSPTAFRPVPVSGRMSCGSTRGRSNSRRPGQCGAVAATSAALTYGGGSLWVGDISGDLDPVGHHGVTQLDPATGSRRRIELDRYAGWLSWSEGYGDLWMNDFDRGSVSRMHAASGVVKTFDSVAANPAAHVVEGDAFWVGDWSSPQVARLHGVGSSTPRIVDLPTKARGAGVTTVAAGAGSIWAAVPYSHALWRIDPRTNRVTRIAIPYYPWGVAAADDEIWVAVRAKP